MSNENISNEDVSAMRREGDLKAFMRQGIRSAQKAHQASVRQFQQQSSRPSADLAEATGHVPGAWPVGPSDAAHADRTTCTCRRCQSFAKGQPELAELLRKTQAHLDGPNA